MIAITEILQIMRKVETKNTKRYINIWQHNDNNDVNTSQSWEC